MHVGPTIPTVNSRRLYGRHHHHHRLVLGAGLITLLWLRYFAVKFGRRAFLLDAEIPSPKANAPEENDQEGVALSELRPIGRAEIGGKRYDVRCEDGFAPAGARLRVSGQEPGNLIVRLIA